MNKNVIKLSSELSEARENMRHADMNSSESDAEDKSDAKPIKHIPSEEEVDKLEERLESSQADQKNLFLIVFQRFIMILSEHIAHCDTDCKSVNTPWYQWTIGRLQEVFMQVIFLGVKN
jgi:nuclear cap-binding protein subunit 1